MVVVVVVAYLSVCLPASLETKQFCKASSIFEGDIIKIAAILRDFLNFRSWQHQKRNNSARLPQFRSWQHQKRSNFARPPSKMEHWVQSWRPRTNAFCDFFIPPIWSIAPATNQWCQIIRSAAPVTQNHLSKPDNLTRQKATSLRKSAAWPPNISAAPAMRNASLQILFKSPRPANIFESATKPSRFPHFWQGAKSLAPATRHDIWTSKSGPGPWVFGHFWLGNVLRATMASNVRCFAHFDFEMCFGHNGVHFFDISTSKSAPVLRCFVHFDFDMCFAPKLACNFSISHLARWLRTRRCSDPTARNSGDNSVEKTQWFATFSTFSPTCIFFLLTLSTSLHLLSSFLW